MIGTIKPFDKNEHSIYDKKGKDSFIRHLNGVLPKGYKAIENPNEFGIDVLVLSPNGVVIVACEIEVRYGNWKGNIEFPFSKINCIERKDHLWKRESSFLEKIPFQISSKCKIYYVQLNDECTRAVMISGEVILQQQLIQWNNRKMIGEYVRQVPIELTKQIALLNV